MNCPRCGNSNRPSSRFCRFCGEILKIETQYSKEVVQEARKPLVNPSKRVFPRGLLYIAILFFTATSVYAAPKVNDFMKVGNSINESKAESASGNYQAALDQLVSAEKRWSTPSQKQELSQLKEAQERFIKYKDVFSRSLDQESSGLLTDARDLLQSINSDYPKYEDVRSKLSEIQSKIEGKLQAETKAASDAKLEADKRAKTEAAARARAQADAQAAFQAKARAESLAASAAQAARDAEVQRQQEVIKRAEEVKRSFRNELTAGYNSYTQGISYYNSAIQYSNISNSLLAISQAGSARAVLNTARNTVADLNSRFTGLPDDYYVAANDMITAIDGLIKATDLLVSSEGSSLDYSSAINSYKDIAVNYAARVKSFLSANSY